MKRTLIAALLLAWTTAAAANPAPRTALAANLADLTLEELSNIVVSSVAGRAQPLSRAPASIYVISAEEIRRSGRTSLVDALRLAPNLDVARADANQWAISARGFNATLANRMLVLIDGRTVYTPLFSGTFWEAQDVMLEDIDRIEVISGPGATLWGANAVNGVINIITRRAGDTQGTLASVQAGTAQQDASARHGGSLGGPIAGGRYRVYGRSVRRENTEPANGNPMADAGEHVQGGFRADWGTPRHGFTLQGDAYEGAVAGQGRDFSGANILARWSRDLGGGAELKVQGYYDFTQREHLQTFRERLHTYDVEVQHGLRPMGAHQLLWGFGLRHLRDQVENSAAVVFQPEDRSLNRNHIFVQDEITLGRDLELTIGVKLDANSYTRTEFLPSARLAWQVEPAHLLWAALSRTVRAPSRIDRELFGPLSVPPLAGGAGFISEVSRVAELGYRAQPTRRLSWSATAFYAWHENLRSLSLTPAGLVVGNDREGETAGLEAWGTWQPADWWRLGAGFVLLDQSLRNRPEAPNAIAPGAEANDPEAWYKLRASFDLTPRHELDLFLRHYDDRPNPAVPDYTALDVRLGWHAAKDVELSLVVHNLLDAGHPEWGPAVNRAEFERAAFVKLRLGQ
ncbi:MAG TPA: TonB-dependent receptor [Myxococcota bacterium]|nr:TonB-dependent receptor [Myxococcota bacterium]